MLLSLAPAQAAAFSVPAVAVPVSGFADIVSDCTPTGFFGLVPWYQYLGKELDDGSKVDRQGNSFKCDVKCFNFTDQGSEPNECGQTKSDVPLVLLAIIDDLLRVAGLVAVGFVLFGSFRFVTSQGNPEATAKARSTIVNALLGLALASVAVGFVSFLGHKLGG